MPRVLTIEQRTRLTDLIVAELVRARASALAAGTDPADLDRAVTHRITVLEATVRVDRTRGRT